MIKIENLSYTHAGKTEALKNVSMEIPNEHIFAILGESGSGKTTLLNCIGRFLKPRQGRILLNDRNIREYEEKELRKSIGIIFQQLFLFPHLCVLDNMTLPLIKVLKMKETQAKDEALEALEKLGIKDLQDSFPSEISGGQAQRAAIARGLVLKPEYLLLDEPTSALDIKTSNEFGNWLISLKAETSFVIVTHDVLFAEKTAASGVLMKDGQVTAKGTMKDILDAMHLDQSDLDQIDAQKLLQ